MTALAAPQNPLQTKVSRIEERIDPMALGTIRASNALGGIQFQSMIDVMEFAKLMAVSDVAIPKHLRANPGACLAVCIQAVEWRMSPYAVANKSYVVNDRIGYESQLIHAVIEQRAPLVGRLRHRFTGENGSRRCIVYATVKGEKEPLEFQSSEFDKIQPKNSPLWKTKPDLQLYYNASRDWARMYFPDVILGVYAEDEIEQAPPAATASDLNKRLAKVGVGATITNVTGEPSQSDIARQALEDAEAKARGAASDPQADSTFDKTTDSDSQLDEQTQSDAAGHTEAPHTDSQTEQDNPAEMNETQIVNWIVRQLPSDVPPADAEHHAKGLVKLLSRKWDKLDKEGRELYIATWKKQNFGWAKAE